MSLSLDITTPALPDNKAKETIINVNMGAQNG